ncbi:MAG: PAS domain S-box protein, partial [Ignavibacteriales bacterium]|nr:PAS domain S-box protein [Ignavibacteriales bacterium]
MNSVREDVFEEPRGHGQALFDNALDAILIVDNEAHCVDANPAACAFLGYSREELLQMNVWDIVQISNQDAGKSWWQSFIQSARRTGEYTVLCKNKTPREVEYRVVANFVSGYHLSILHDITEHKQAERELRLLAQAVASTRDCFCLTDLNNNILFVNKAFYETYGYTEEELFGKNVSFLQSQNTRPEVIDQMITSTIAGGWNGELINCRKDGSEFPIELWTSVVRDDSGNPVGLVGVARDITERKRAEESLRESEERYRAVMQSANDAIISADDNGKIISWNRGAHVIFGYTEDEALGQPLTVLMQERYHAHYQQGL